MGIDFENKIAPLIQQKRAQGMSDVVMEKAMKIPEHSINRWFNKTNKSYTKYISNIANYFEKPVSYFYDQEETRPDEGDGLDAQLLKKLMILTPDERAKVDAFVQGLLAARSEAASLHK